MARGSVLDRFTFGGRLPGAVGLVLALTVAASLFVAFGSRHAAPLFDYAALVPARVLAGEAWRLLTWPFIEASPIALLFGCLFLYWFGRDLGYAWGSKKFLAVYLGVVAIAGIGTTLLSLVDPAVRGHAYLGGWAPAAAMTVAWGFWFPDREIRLWFILPLRGYLLAWLTIGVTIVLSIYSGWERYLPELFAEGSILVWLFRRSIASRWSRARRSFDDRRQHARVVEQRERAKRAAKVGYLRVVDRDDDDEPPALPPEVKGTIDRIFENARPPKKDVN